jgi:hypothetical protein
VAAADNACSYLLSDNREVIRTWDHAVEWIVTDWALCAIEAVLTHIANVMNRELMSGQSVEAMFPGIEG